MCAPFSDRVLFVLAMEGIPERGIFPLPVPVDDYLSNPFCSRSVKRRAQCKRHWVSWLADGVSTLNELSGFAFGKPFFLPCNLVQSKVCKRLRNAYARVPKPDSSITSAGAFHELCGCASCYDLMLAGLLAAYQQDRVSWPPECSAPTALRLLLACW